VIGLSPSLAYCAIFSIMSSDVDLHICICMRVTDSVIDCICVRAAPPRLRRPSFQGVRFRDTFTSDFVE